MKVAVIHGAVGGINESDVMLASASGAIIVGFNVRPDSNAKNIAEKDGVDIRLYRVIYDCLEEIEAAMKGMLAPKFPESEPLPDVMSKTEKLHVRPVFVWFGTALSCMKAESIR